MVTVTDIPVDGVILLLTQGPPLFGHIVLGETPSSRLGLRTAGQNQVGEFPLLWPELYAPAPSELFGERVAK